MKYIYLLLFCISLSACDGLTIPSLPDRSNIEDPLTTVRNRPPKLIGVSNTDNNKVSIEWAFADVKGNFIDVRTSAGGYTSTSSIVPGNNTYNFYYYSTVDRSITLQTGASGLSRPYNIKFSQTNTEIPNSASTLQIMDYGLRTSRGTFFHFPTQTEVPIPNYTPNALYAVSQDKNQFAKLYSQNGKIILTLSNATKNNSFTLFEATDLCFNTFGNPKNETFIHFNPSGTRLGISCPTNTNTGQFFVFNTQTQEMLLDAKNLNDTSIYGLLRFSDDLQHIAVYTNNNTLKTIDLQAQSVVLSQDLPAEFFGFSQNGQYAISCSDLQCKRYRRTSFLNNYALLNTINKNRFVLPGTIRTKQLISNNGTYSITEFRGSDGFSIFDFAAVFDWVNDKSTQNYTVSAPSLGGSRGIPLFIDSEQVIVYAAQYPTNTTNSIVRFPIRGQWQLVP
jgi:hypothetical protein